MRRGARRLGGMPAPLLVPGRLLLQAGAAGLLAVCTVLPRLLLPQALAGDLFSSRTVLLRQLLQEAVAGAVLPARAAGRPKGLLPDSGPPGEAARRAIEVTAANARDAIN